MIQKTPRVSSGPSAGAQDKNRKVLIRSAAVIVCAAFILLIPVLLNGFPFIFPDSGDYIFFTPRVYRSPFYGLFIFFFHLNRWIWMPVFAQALIVSHLLWLMLKLSGARQVASKTLLLALLLTVFSSLPYFVGYIMADLFTPVMFITMYILGFYYTELSWRLRIYLILLACVATSAHVANLTMAVGLFYVFVLLLPWCGVKRAVIIKRLGVLLVPIGLTTAAVFLFNGLIFGMFSLAPIGSAMFMTNLIKYGPAQHYLEKTCPDSGYKMCLFKTHLAQVADNLLWNPDAVQKLGGYAGLKRESKIIVEGTLKTYPYEVVAVIVQNFVVGLMSHEPAAEIQSNAQVPWVIDSLMIKFGPHAVEKYLNSAEMRDIIPHDVIKSIDNIVVPLAFFALAGLGLFAARRRDRQNAALAAIMIAGVLGNTLLCTAVSGVYDRYQARVTWLLPMAVFVIVSSLVAKGKTRNVTTPIATRQVRRKK